MTIELCCRRTFQTFVIDAGLLNVTGRYFHHFRELSYAEISSTVATRAERFPSIDTIDASGETMAHNLHVLARQMTLSLHLKMRDQLNAKIGKPACQ